MCGEATPAQVAGFLDGAAGQGRDGRGDARPRRPDARPRPPHRGARTQPRHRRHRWATAAHGQHLDDGRHGLRGRRGHGGQARQPRRVLVLGVGRRPRGARGRPRPPGRPRRARSRRGRASPSASPRSSTPPSATPPAARSELGVGTAFNFLGPLTNPAQPTYAAVGSPTAGWPPIVAGVFAGAGRTRAVFRGDDGLDELTLETTSSVWWVRRRRGARGTVSTRRASACQRQPHGCPARRRRRPQRPVVRDVSPARPGPVRDAVVLNAGRPRPTREPRCRRRRPARGRPRRDGPGRGAIDSGAAAALLSAGSTTPGCAARRSRRRLGRADQSPPSRPRLKAASRSCRE